MYSSTPSSTRQYEARSSNASSGDPKKSLSPEQASHVPPNQLKASTSPHATRRSADEKQLPVTPGKVPKSQTFDRQSEPTNLMAPSVVPLKLIPSPHIAQMAEPTQRGLLEQRKEQPVVDRAQSRQERYSPNRESDNSNVRSASAFGYHNGEPKTPKKSSFLNRIKSSWRAIPSFGGTMTAETRNHSIPDTFATAMGDSSIIHAQPKAQAILVGRSPSKPVPRSPSKRNFFRWKADESSSHVNFSLKIASPDPGLLSSSETSPEISAHIVQQVRKDAPTPPAKDTPPHIKSAQQGPAAGLGLRGIEPASNIEAFQRPPRFGTSSRLEIAPLITNPNEHQYHASVVPELVNWEELKRLTSRLEGLDLHGLPLPRKNSQTVLNSDYSPSLYSPEMGSDPAGMIPSMPRTRRSTINSETRSTLRDVLTASPQTNPLPAWTPNLNSKRGFESSSDDQTHNARSVSQLIKQSTTGLSHSVAPMPGYHTVDPQMSARQTHSLHKSRAVSSATVTIAYPGLTSDPSMTKLEDPDTASQLEAFPRDVGDTPSVPERNSSLSFKNDVFTSATTSDAKIVERDVFSDDPKIVLSPEQVGRGALPATNSKGHAIDGDFGFPAPVPHALQKAILVPSLQHLPTLPMTTFVEPLKPKRPKRPSVSSHHSATLADTSTSSNRNIQHQPMEGMTGAALRDGLQDYPEMTLSDFDEKVDLEHAEHDSAFEDLLDSVSGRAEERRKVLELAIAGSRSTSQASSQRPQHEIEDQTDIHTINNLNPVLQPAPTPTHKDPKPTPSAPEEPSFLTHHLSREPSSPALESSPDITKGHSSRRTFQKTKRTRIITTSHSGSPREKKSSRNAPTDPQPTLEETLAQNRAYEERIAELVRRLEAAETKGGR
jgi:hypothetical protein